MVFHVLDSVVQPYDPDKPDSKQIAEQLKSGLEQDLIANMCGGCRTITASRSIPARCRPLPAVAIRLLNMLEPPFDVFAAAYHAVNRAFRDRGSSPILRRRFRLF